SARSHDGGATAALPTTATLSSGKASDLTTCLRVMTPVDELLLGLHPPVRMAVADLSGCDLLQPGLVGLELSFSQDLDPPRQAGPCPIWPEYEPPRKPLTRALRCRR